MDLTQLRILIWIEAYYQSRLAEAHHIRRNKVQLAYRRIRYSPSPTNRAARLQAVVEAANLWSPAPVAVRKAAYHYLIVDYPGCEHRLNGNATVIVNKVIHMCHDCYYNDDIRNRIIGERAKYLMLEGVP
jgi:hypothetical protein